jgi:hypothetical protein
VDQGTSNLKMGERAKRRTVYVDDVYLVRRAITVTTDTEDEARRQALDTARDARLARPNAPAGETVTTWARQGDLTVHGVVAS